MASWLLSLISGFLIPLIKDLVSDWRRDKALQDKGRTEGAVELNRTIAEAADEQAKINAADRGGADDVLERLRKRLDRNP